MKNKDLIDAAAAVLDEHAKYFRLLATTVYEFEGDSKKEFQESFEKKKEMIKTFLDYMEEDIDELIKLHRDK